MSEPNRSARSAAAAFAASRQALADIALVDAFFLDPVLDRQVEIERGRDAFLEAGGVPLLGIGGLGNVAGDERVDHLGAHLGDDLRKVFGIHQLDALLEDDLALVVHDVVVFEKVLADVEVARLDLLLRLLQRLVDPRMDDRLALLEAERLQHAVHALGAEDAHQIVLDRQVEFRAAGIALAAGAAAQLVVDAAAFVAFGGEHVEAAGGERLVLQPLHVLADRLLLARRAPGRPAFRRARAGRACRHCRRAGCRCRGRPCWWRW